MCISTYKDNFHWANLASGGTPSIWVSYAKGHPTSTHQSFNPKNIILTQNVTWKTCGCNCKLWGIRQGGWAWNGSESDPSKDDFENNQNNYFDDNMDNQVKASPQTTLNSKVVQAMKKLQAPYSDNANKIIKHAMQEKMPLKIQIFSSIWLWWLATSCLYLKSPRTSLKPRAIQMQIPMKKCEKQLEKNLPTWTSDRYGTWQVKVLCLAIAGVWRTSRFSRSNVMVCTKCILLHVGSVRYPASIFWALFFDSEWHNFPFATVDGTTFCLLG